MKTSLRNKPPRSV